MAGSLDDENKGGAPIWAGLGAAAAKLLKTLPGVEPVLVGVETAEREAEKREVQKYIERVAQAIAKGDLTGLSVDVGQGLEKPHVHQAVVSSYAKMGECVDERAKPCLAVLVAQRMCDATFTTAYFKHCADLLADSDEQVLTVLGAITEAYLETLQCFGGRDVQSRALATCELDEHRPRTFWVTLRIGGETRRSKILDQPSGWARAMRLLDKHEFGHLLVGWSSVAHRPDLPEKAGSIILDWEPQHDVWMRGLHVCLAAHPT